MINTIKTVGIMLPISVMLIVFVWKRLILASFLNKKENEEEEVWAACQTTGNQEVQADMVQVYQNEAGMIGVLADGIGKENTGKLCAQITIDTILDNYEPYQTINNPEYLLRNSLLEANSRIQKTIGERRGGASVGILFIEEDIFHYALVGNIRIALLRNDELIPISKGHTMNVLAMDAYKEGLLSRQETMWSLDESRVWNYLGKEEFREIEYCRKPIHLKPGDLIYMASSGIFDELSWAEIEDILLDDLTLQEKADSMVMKAETKNDGDKENGSVLLLGNLKQERHGNINEKNQF